jgi:ribosomal protein L37AE/L43A
MEWDDDFDNGYSDMDVVTSGSSSNQNKGSSEGGFDPLDITNPASAYLFLSDDAQDEISRKENKKMKCQSCKHRFKGETYDSCPKCESVFTEEVLSFMEDEDASQSPNMKCLGCGHLFSGESYDSCTECFSTMTEEISQEKDDEY